MLKKMIRNPHADLDHCQKVTSRGLPIAHACQVLSTSVSALLSCSQNDRQNDHITSAKFLVILGCSQPCRNKHKPFA